MTDSTTVVTPAVVTVVANKNPPETAKIEEESSVYIYDKQQVKEKVKSAMQEFTKDFREEEEMLKVTIK